MSKVIILSTKYPVNHPKAGQSTNFVEKVWEGIWKEHAGCREFHLIKDQFEIMYRKVFAPKLHTLRAGRRWKAGMKISPRIWTGKPYASKQLAIAPDLELANVLDVEITIVANSMIVGYRPKDNPEQLLMIPLDELAKNDGLATQDFIDWFKMSSKEKRQRPDACANIDLG